MSNKNSPSKKSGRRSIKRQESIKSRRSSNKLLDMKKEPVNASRNVFSEFEKKLKDQFKLE